MTLTSDGRRLALLQRRVTWVEPDEVSSSRPHFTFLHSWRTTTTTDMWRMHVNGNAGANRSHRIRSRWLASSGILAIREYRCRYQANHANRCNQWAFAWVRLLEHDQPDCQRESPRAHWFLMSFWCHSILSSSLFRAWKYTCMLIIPVNLMWPIFSFSSSEGTTSFSLERYFFS